LTRRRGALFATGVERREKGEMVMKLSKNDPEAAKKYFGRQVGVHDRTGRT